MSEKLSIYVLADYRPGLPDGLAEFSYQNTSLVKDVFDFHFVEFRLFEEREFYDLDFQDDVRIHSFGVFNVPKWRLSPQFVEWVEALPRENIVFHLGHIYNFNNYLVARLLTRLQIRYLITPHDSYVYGTAFKKSRSVFKRIYREIFVYFIDKYVLDHASVIHAITNQCLPNLRRITRSPVMVVENQVQDMGIGFDADQIEPQLCFIGRTDILQKGIDRALRGFKKYKSRPDSNPEAKLTMIGQANPSAARLRSKICNELDLKVGKDVFFTGKIPETDRNEILKRSRAYIHLSRFEGFGLSLIQALLSYTPVIVSEEIPISDKILEYKAGFVTGSDEETGNAIAAIFSMSDAEYNTLARNARRCYEQEFHPQVIRPQLIRLYETAAGI